MRYYAPMQPGDVSPDLTIIIPVYNEVGTLEELLEKLFLVDFGVPVQIIAVDDGSKDGSGAILARHADKIEVHTHAVNRGKGAAIRTGLTAARGEYIVIQDADLEYEPADLARLYAHAKETGARAVYGSRQLARSGNKRGRLDFYLGGILVTIVTNILYGTHLTDEPTCYKLIAHELYDQFHLTSDGFDFCPEVTSKIAKLGVRIEELPIAYHPRSLGEGKKIRAWDGVTAIWTLVKNRVS